MLTCQHLLKFFAPFSLKSGNQKKDKKIGEGIDSENTKENGISVCDNSRGIPTNWPTYTDNQVIHHLSSRRSNHSKRTDPFQRTTTTTWHTVQHLLLWNIWKCILYGQTWNLVQLSDHFILKFEQSTKYFIVKSEIHAQNISKKLISENWSQFNSQVFIDFATEFNFNNRKLTPYWHKTKASIDVTTRSSVFQ